MEAVRRYVFPVIWMLILGVVAASLGKMAFFPDGAAAADDDTISPTAAFDEYALVAAETGDIASELELSAAVRADEGTAVRATTAGEITRIWVEDGDTVAEDDRILQVRVPQEAEPVAPAEPVVETGPDGMPLVTEPAPVAEPEVTYSYHTLRAEVGGTVEDLAVLDEQVLSIGDAVATISPGTYGIVAALTPEQQLDLLDRDVTATADLPTSSEPVTCEAPNIEAVDGDADAPAPAPAIDPMTGMPLEGSGETTAELRCDVPEGTRVVPGLAVTVTIDLGAANGVITVPTTAVEGTLADGTVYLLDEATGEPTPHEVGLGLRGDGVVEVTSGLEAGQEILQFVPGVDNPDAGTGEEMVW
jgi:hypothetical protein